MARKKKYKNPEDRFLRKNRGPWNKSTGRDYSKEKPYKSTKSYKKDAVARNKARRQAIKDGRVKKGDGKDVHHTNGLRSNKTRIEPKSVNRGRAEKSRRKGSKRS